VPGVDSLLSAGLYCTRLEHLLFFSWHVFLFCFSKLHLPFFWFFSLCVKGVRSEQLALTSAVVWQNLVLDTILLIDNNNAGTPKADEMN